MIQACNLNAQYYFHISSLSRISVKHKVGKRVDSGVTLSAPTPVKEMLSEVSEALEMVMKVMHDDDTLLFHGRF